MEGKLNRIYQIDIPHSHIPDLVCESITYMEFFMLTDILLYLLVYTFCQMLAPLAFTAVVGINLPSYIRHVMMCNVVTTVYMAVYFIFGPLGVDVGIVVLLPLTIGAVYGLLLIPYQPMCKLLVYSIPPVLLTGYMTYQWNDAMYLYTDGALTVLPLAMILLIYIRRWLILYLESPNL